MTENTRNIGFAGESEQGTDQAVGFARSLAVVVGINNYADPIPALKTPGNDARRIKEVLEGQQKFEVLPPLTQDVTLKRLLELFTETLPRLNLDSSDRLLVYFAGHGTEMSGAGGEPEYYLVPQDARPDDRDSFLPMRLVRDALLKLKCRHLLLVLDCCFAGGFGRMRSFDDLPPKIYRQRFDFYVSSPAWQVIASAAHDETALDTAGGCVFGRRAIGAETEHSPFASALFDALEGQADVNPASQEGEPAGDGLITAAELYVWIRDRVQVVAGTTHRQSPGLWPLPNHEAGEFVFRNPERALSLEDALPLTAGANPYRGLNSYDEAQSHLFFGRAKQIAALTEKVAAEPFVAVLGVSGTGKSSLAKAGLIPALGGSHRAGDPAEPRQVGEMCWLTLPPFRPTAEPVASLARLLTDHLPTYVQQVPAPASDATALAALVSAWRADHRGARLALVIDQFEELVTLCADKEQRQHFQALLANALAAPGDSLRVIITLRTDFEPQYNQGVLQPFWGNQARYVVLPMSQDELRQVILGPAWASEIYFESRALVDALINEVVQAPGGLPLLSFALSEMYLRYIASGRQDRTLRQADFDAVGGVIGSLRAAANAIWDGLDPAHQATMERLMLRMIAIGGGEVARRRVAWAELDYGEPENTRRDAVIGQLEEARLVVPDEDARWVEPAHDALVSGWDRLMEWKFTAASYLPLQRDLAPAALRWQAADAKAKSSLLWDRDPRLPQVEETLWPTGSKQHGLSGRMRWGRRMLIPATDAPADTKWLNKAEVTFAQTSVRARARFWQRTIGLGLIVLLVTGVLVAFSFNQQQQSTASARVAATEQVLRATSDANATVAVANEATAKVAEATAVFEAKARGTAQAQEAQARATAELARATAVFEAKARGTAQAQEAQARATAVAAQAETERIKRGIQADQLTVNALKVVDESPPLALLLAVEGMRAQNDFTTTVVLAEPVTPQTTTPITRSAVVNETIVGSAVTNVYELLSRTGGIPLAGHEGDVVSVAFSPDGHRLATASGDKTARLWDMADLTAAPRILAGHEAAVLSVAFSPDGRWLATASSDKTAHLWDTTDPGATPRTLRGHEDTVRLVAFSLDGRWLATASDDKTARLWDMADPAAAPRILAGHQGIIWAVAFSPDGRQLATASDDATARLWDLGNSAAAPRILAGHESRIKAVAFSPDSRWLATASGNPYSGPSDNTVRLWDMADPAAAPRILAGHENAVNAVAFSPDGRWLATASDDDTTRLWDLADPAAASRILVGHVNDVWAVAFSPDGRWLATASWDKTARLWDTADSRVPSRILVGHEGGVDSVAFSLDGRWLATASWDHTARLWNMANLPAASRILAGHSAAVRDIAFSPDGRWLATASVDATARLWDPADPAAPPRILDDKQWWVVSVAFSPDGRWLATASVDATARLWDLANPGVAPRILDGHENAVNVVAFSPDGRWLATASSDTTARLWDMADPTAAPRILAGHENLVNAVAFSPDGRWLATASDDNTAHLWELADPAAAPRILAGHADDVVSAAFSRDSRWLATASWDKTARLWDVADPAAAPLLLVGHEDRVNAVAFSPDGRWLATVSDDATARLWDMADSAATPRILAGHYLAVTSVTFSPDGHWLATASRDTTARLWEMANSGTTPRILVGHEYPISALAFSPDGRWLATASGDDTARLWTWRVDDLIATVCGFAGRNLTVEEWRRYLPDRPYRGTCSQWPVQPSVTQGG